MDQQSPGAGHRIGQPRAGVEKPGNDRERVRHWLAEQVAEYEKQRPHYETYAKKLKDILRLAAAELSPLAIIQTREKSIASFAEKAVRKKDKYADPVYQLTDLCGGRVIAHTRSEVDAFCDFLKHNFDIDWDNSLDTSQRLSPTEFGYRSIHYIVELRRDKAEAGAYGVDIPEELFGRKAEVQVRTLVEHAYADFGHDLSYKGAFEIPTAWKRELACVAAALEEVDQTFSRIEDRLREYITSYGKYSSDEERQREMDMLEIILEHVPENAELSTRLGQLARAQEDWGTAIKVLSRCVDRENPEAAPQPVLRDLGVALCKAHEEGSQSFQLGRQYLQLAIAADPTDVDAMCSLAGTWKGIDEEQTRDYYRRAFEVDPHDAYALGNYLECELSRGTAVLDAARPMIKKAVQRCDAHIAAGINLPWAFYDLGKFHFLLGEPYESLEAYAKAVQLSTAPWMIRTSLASVERLCALAPELEGGEWNRRLLLLGLTVRFGSTDASAEATEVLGQLATADRPTFRLPVRIVAGGTDPRVQAQIGEYSDLLMEGLAGFDGTIISGATTEGICGLVGDAAQRYRGRIHTVGYVPDAGFGEATGATIDDDPERYSELRYTDGRGFTPVESLQSWIDLVVSGVPAGDVRVVGINGGRIAAAEYRIALALGAAVGVISESGREAGRILMDARWATSERLISLPRDPQTVRAFFGSTGLHLDSEECETIAQAIHEDYLAERAKETTPEGRAMMPWRKLDEEFRESNRSQARHIEEKLRAIGCVSVPWAEAAGERVVFRPDEIERMAEMEHGRYNTERLLRGWRFSEAKDEKRKLSPHLVAWSELPEHIREYDRKTVRKIPDFLAEANRAIQRKS